MRAMLSIGCCMLLALSSACRNSPKMPVANLQETRDQQEVSPVSQHPIQELEPLSWLIGEWEDIDPDVDVQTKTTWGYGGKYIIQHFVVEMEDEEAMSGEQWISWDPREKKIRSWIFDSDGGFAEGVWHQEGKDWVLHLVATLPNGSKGSASYLFSQIEPEQYVWESSNRQVGDRLLENVGPVSVVRKKIDGK